MKTCEVDGEGKPGKEQLDRINKILSKIPGDDILEKNADYLKALADPTRIKIIYILNYGELCACEINSALNKSQPTISHHLNILKKAGFLKWRKEGIWIYYSLSNQKLVDNLNELLRKE